MSRQRFVLLLAAAFLAICAALYLNTRRNLDSVTPGARLFPSLAQELNTVTELNVVKGGKTPLVTIRKQGEQWTVAQRNNYPADVAKLRKLLLALSDAKIREEKTANPASYPIIGVEDPSLAGATGAQIDLVAQDGMHGVIVGKPVGEGSFVRRTGEKISYIVEPGISFEAEPRYWIDTRLLDLPTDKIQSIEVKPTSGPGYAVRLTAPDAPSAKAGAVAAKFALEPVPPTRIAAESQILAPSPTAFGNLSPDDVAQAGDIDFNKPSVATVTLLDGSLITVTGTVVGEKHWIQVTAPKDTALTAKAGGRAFEIAGYRYDAIFRPLEQLLVPLPPPPEKKLAAPSKPAPKHP
ncbi:MAG TPA: DUF4340 domain-containing protein [Steroidobacteraceae bacterium]|jgi:hypothetical protein